MGGSVYGQSCELKSIIYYSSEINSNFSTNSTSDIQMS